MAKETFYFSHDYNARTDSKTKKLLAKHGYAGYGIFWAIVEDLYNNSNSLPVDFESMAFDLRSDVETIKSIITEFELFVIDGKIFKSLSVEKRMNERKEKSVKASESAKKRWSNAVALPTQSDSNAIKESKVKESKVKEKGKGENLHPLKNSNIYRQPNIPTISEVKKAFQDAGGGEEMAQRFFDSNEAVGWFLKNSPITNFKNLIPSYISNWNKYKENGINKNDAGLAGIGRTLVFDKL